MIGLLMECLYKSKVLYKINIVFFVIFSFLLVEDSMVYGQMHPPISVKVLDKKVPIGMNLNHVNYYSPMLMFTDAKKGSGEFFSYPSGSWDTWNSGKISKIPVDESGYPLQIPCAVDGVQQEVRFLLNPYYKGEYVLLYDGQGSVTFGGVQVKVVEGRNHLIFSGNFTNQWVNITSSVLGKHIRNIRIIPVEYLQNEDGVPVFRGDFIEGLRPFHALRFMDTGYTNDSNVSLWSQRTAKTWHTQGGTKGVALEYMIDLANQLQADPWFCIPHKATDEYITQMASLIKSKLYPNRKVYIEFSNEMWNWIFKQSVYIIDNAPDHLDTYVTRDLCNISPHVNVTVSQSVFTGGATKTNGSKFMLSSTGQLPSPLQAYHLYYVVNASGNSFQVAETEGGVPIELTNQGSGDFTYYAAGGNHPEKDAYMMARAFKIFNRVYFDKRSNLVNVAAIQVAWVDTFQRVMSYLFNTDGVGADAISPTGYFSGISSEKHAIFNAMPVDDVTPEMILGGAYAVRYNENYQSLRSVAEQYGVDIVIYEGGQHLQPYNQQDWGYNQAVYDAQIHQIMYDNYMQNFDVMNQLGVKLFIAYSYISPRMNKAGSWGHLENLGQLAAKDALMKNAPKFQALLEGNAPK